VSFAVSSEIQSVSGHVLGGTPGETFHVSLYDASFANLPANALYSATATFSGDGWNGVSGLTGWNVSSGLFWLAFEVAGGDTLGSGSITGAVLDQGAPTPVARTAFSSTGGSYEATRTPLSIGLRVDAIAAVPEPTAFRMMLAGLLVASATVWLRRRG
jgi:hypothetical protein